MKKKWLGLALAVCAMVSVLTGCGSAGSDGAIKLKIATVGNESHQSTIAATAFKEKLEELAGDRFEITIYPNASWAASVRWRRASRSAPSRWRW